MKEIEHKLAETARAAQRASQALRARGDAYPRSVPRCATIGLGRGAMLGQGSASAARAARVLALSCDAAIRHTNRDDRELDELFPGATAVPAIDAFAPVDAKKHGPEEEKLEAVADEFDRARRAQLESAEVSCAFGAALGATKRAVQLANNCLHEMTATFAIALLAAIALAMQATTPIRTGVVGPLARILGTDGSADAKTRKRGDDAHMLHAAKTELTQTESHG